MKKKALILGVSGQDGSYLAKLLLSKGYSVYGGSRDAETINAENHKYLKIHGKIKYVSINLYDFRSVFEKIVNIKPDEIYNLSGQSSVGLSFGQPMETFESISSGTLNVLEAIRFSKIKTKFYNAGSSESFGNVSEPVTESTPFNPRSPYGVAKATAYWTVSLYREAYNLFACTGILFNHESPLRKDRFVTKKIISTACRIYNGSEEKLKLGNTNVYRDWGYAPEYVEAIWAMLQLEKPEDFVIASGKSTSLMDFVRNAFESLGLDWKEHVLIDDSLFRPTDISMGNANPRKAKEKLNWNAKTTVNEIINKMVEFELSKNLIKL